ncbi:MAG: hypothetical protein P1P87_09645, partial [Trueperaceae bacterium]|nr:hypothetical protein [Trueperaceae bacterium]
VRVEGATEAEAVARDGAVAQALAAWDQGRATAFWQEEAAAAQERVEALTARVRAAQVLGTEAADGDLDALIDERDAALARLAGATQALSSGGAGGLAPLPAIVRTRPATPWRPAGLAAGLTFGLAILAALRPSARPFGPARERIRDRAAGRTRAPTGVPVGRAPAPAAVLAVFPYAGAEDAVLLRSAAATLLEGLREHLASVRRAVVLVTSLHEGEGVTTVAVHMAEALARSGARTLLVDGSLREPALAARYAVVAPSGDVPVDAPRIASTLDWMRRPDGRHHVVGVDVGGGRHLDLVPQFHPTRPEPGTAETFFEPFGDALERWRGYEVVVVDAAPLAPVADARYLLPFATGVVVVIDRDRDDRRRRLEAAKRARMANARLLGFVVNEPAAAAVRVEA